MNRFILYISFQQSGQVALVKGCLYICSCYLLFSDLLKCSGMCIHYHYPTGISRLFAEPIQLAWHTQCEPCIEKKSHIRTDLLLSFLSCRVTSRKIRAFICILTAAFAILFGSRTFSPTCIS